MRLLLHVIMLCGVLLIGCNTDEHIKQQITRAEKMMIDHPDSALEIMQSIDCKSIHNEGDIAHYRLAMAEAYYYNRIVPSCDSLTRPLFDYYLTSDDHAKRARALYIYAISMKDEGYIVEAMNSLTEAEKSLQCLNNHRLQGLVHRTKAEIYGSECLFQNALEEYQKAQQNFREADLEYHTIYCNTQIGQTLIHSHSFKEATSYLTEALNYAITNNLQDFTAENVLLLLELYTSTNELAKSTELFFEYEEFLKTDPCSYHYYRSYAQAFNKRAEDAIESLKLATQYGVDPIDLEQAYYNVYRTLGDDKSTLSHLEKLLILQNELVLSSLAAPTLNSQLELRKQENEALIMYNKYIRLRNIVIFFTFVLALIIVVLLFLRKISKQKRDIEQYIASIEELNMTSRNTPIQMSDMIDKLYKSRFKELNDLYDIYYDSSGSSRQMKIVFEQLHNTIESIKNDKRRINELENIVDEYCDHIITKLNEQCPRLTDRQKRIALYAYAGFSLRAIALFMNSSPVQISKDKYKIKSVIRSSESKDCETLIKHL